MHYVILRDDDTNALTPAEHLERLYRPFLDRGLPVNLAVIPNVRTDATDLAGRPEGFLGQAPTRTAPALPIGGNGPLVRYLRDNPGYHIAQHGLHHSPCEFEAEQPADVKRWLEVGSELLEDAGFPKPQTFVAPHDRLSRASLRAVARRFRVLSSGWYELARLPFSWWPGYALKKAARRPHWRAGGMQLLTHPGCLLSCQHPCDTMIHRVRQTVLSQRLTVLVTHWWEYFQGGKPDEPFIQVLHETAKYLDGHPHIRVVSFNDVAAGKVPIA